MCGFSLHAGTVCEAHQRSKLERLCRYFTRPPIATKRLAVDDQGRVVYRYKRPFRDGPTPAAHRTKWLRVMDELENGHLVQGARPGYGAQRTESDTKNPTDRTKTRPEGPWKNRNGPNQSLNEKSGAFKLLQKGALYFYTLPTPFIVYTYLAI